MKYLLLENIRSAYNVGAIFRTADATGVEKLFLVGHTPTPIDRFGRTQTEIQKTSLGASEYIPWEHHETAESILTNLQAQQVCVVVVEQTKNAILLGHFSPPPAVVYVLGNEVDGVSQAVLKMADTIVELPMLGKKESLNVSVTAGVVLYHGVIEKS
jgi:tRNA G18 (ribose-2'-O)-methylase SpoU